MKVFKVLSFLLIMQAQAWCQPVWKLAKEKNGIKVFLASTENSKFKSIRVQGVFDGSISGLMRILSNMDKAPEWVYKTRKAYIIKQVTPLEFYYYTECSMPWPVTNRDAVIHLKMQPDTAHHLLNIVADSEPVFMAKKNGLIRIPYSKATWRVTEASNKINIDYTFEVNPGGSLPAWLVNMMADKGPYETFSKLMAKLKQS